MRLRVKHESEVWAAPRARACGREPPYTAPMGRRELPQFIAEVVEDRAALRTLGACALALAAAGLNPQVTSPFIIDVQSAIRAQPELLALSSLVAVLGAGMILAGGVAADAFRTRRILSGALIALLTAAIVSAVVVSGPIFLASRFAGAVSAGIVIPFAIAAVATAYRGTARATAIGVAYAGLGAGMALPPILLDDHGARRQRPAGVPACGLVAALGAAAQRSGAGSSRRRPGDRPGRCPHRALGVRDHRRHRRRHRHRQRPAAGATRDHRHWDRSRC